MSAVKKLEGLLKRLENTKSAVQSAKGGYFGLAKVQGGAKPRCKCAQCKYAKCRCGGGQLMGGVQNFDGSGLTGGAVAGFDGGRKKRGGRSCGAGLTGGAVAGFDGGRTPKGMMPPQLKPWLDHVRKVRAQNPGAPYKDVLKMAKSSYRK